MGKIRNVLSLAPILSLLLLGVACNGNSSPSVSPLSISMLVEDANGTQADSFSSGQEIHLVMKVDNQTGKAVPIEVQQCGPDNETLVADAANGEVVFGASYPEGVVYCHHTGAMIVDIEPGVHQSLLVWDQMMSDATQLVAPGKYRASAKIICDPSSGCADLQSADATFTINP